MKQFHGRWCCLETHHDSALEGSLKKVASAWWGSSNRPHIESDALSQIRDSHGNISVIVQHLSKKRIIAPSADVASFEGQSPCSVAHENYHMSHQAF